MIATRPTITFELVRALVRSQFPQWAHRGIVPVEPGGWDNHSFRLGEDLVVRLPSAAQYAFQPGREHRWLPVLAPHLTQPIPLPVALGEPQFDYPWQWSVRQWLPGETALPARIDDPSHFAADLAAFLRSLQAAPAAGGPPAGAETFHRGGSLWVYDNQARQAISVLAGHLDREAVTADWEAALARPWSGSPCWVHGDISVGNLLVRNGRLCGVLDFGQLCVGDPACDLAIAWSLFDEHTRSVFREALRLDAATWLRGRGWALWKALIVAAGLAETNAWEGTRAWDTIASALADRGAPEA